MNSKVKILLICVFLLPFVICLGQTNNHEFIYNKEGNKIAFDEIENVIHVGFVTGVSMNTRNEVLADLSSIADYYMLPDSSYCFTVDAGYATQFKTKVFANSHVSYCQNEYRDSSGGVVWGDCELKIENGKLKGWIIRKKCINFAGEKTPPLFTFNSLLLTLNS